MFIADRDLLAFEPNLFRDVVWVGQRRTGGTASVSGTTLTCASPDVAFDQAGIGAGDVVVLAGAAYEVTGLTGGTQMEVSRLRESTEIAAIPVGTLTNQAMWVVSFRPQIAQVHGRVLRMLGIEPGAAPGPGVLTEVSVMNPAALGQVEALGTLHLIFAAASLGGGTLSPFAQRAEWYRRKFAEERQRVIAEIDTDGDGVADAARRLNAAVMTRG